MSKKQISIVLLALLATASTVEADPTDCSNAVLGLPCGPDTLENSTPVRNIQRTIASLNDPNIADNYSIKSQALTARQSTESCQVYLDTSSLPCPTTENVGTRVLTQEDVNALAQDYFKMGDAALAEYKKMFGSSPFITFYHPNGPDIMTEMQSFDTMCQRAAITYANSNRDAVNTYFYPMDQATCRQVKAFVKARNDINNNKNSLAFATIGTLPSGLLSVQLPQNSGVKSADYQYQHMMTQLGLDPEMVAALQQAPTAAEIAALKKQGIDATQIKAWLDQFHKTFIAGGGNAKWMGLTDDGPLVRVSMPVIKNSDGTYTPLQIILQNLAADRITTRIIASQDTYYKTRWAQSKHPGLTKFLDMCVKPIKAGAEDAKTKMEYLLAAMPGSEDTEDKQALNDWMTQTDQATKDLQTKGQIQRSNYCYTLARGAGDMLPKAAAAIIAGFLTDPIGGIAIGSALFGMDTTGQLAQDAHMNGKTGEDLTLSTIENLYVVGNVYGAVGAAGEAVTGMVGDSFAKSATNPITRILGDIIPGRTSSTGTSAAAMSSTLNRTVTQAMIDTAKKQFLLAANACVQMSFITMYSALKVTHPDYDPVHLTQAASTACALGAVIHLGGAVALKAGVTSIEVGKQMMTRGMGTLTIVSIDPTNDLVLAVGAKGQKIEYKLSALKNVDQSTVDTQIGQGNAKAIRAQVNVLDAKTRMAQGLFRKGDPLVNTQTGQTYTIETVTKDPSTGKNLYKAILGDGSNGKRYQFTQDQLAGGKSKLVYGGRDLVQLDTNVEKAKAVAAAQAPKDTEVAGAHTTSSDSAAREAPGDPNVDSSEETTPEKATHDPVFSAIREKAISGLQKIVDKLNWSKKYQLAADDNLLVQHVVDGLNPEEVTWLETELEKPEGPKEIEANVTAAAPGCFAKASGAGAPSARNDWDVDGTFRGILYAESENGCKMEL